MEQATPFRVFADAGAGLPYRWLSAGESWVAATQSPLGGTRGRTRRLKASGTAEPTRAGLETGGTAEDLPIVSIEQARN